MRTLVSLLAGLLMGATVHARNQGEIMNDQSPTRTLCLGRFLVDVPKDAYVVANSSDYRSRSISVEPMGRDAFQRMLVDKEDLLKSIKHEKEPSLLKQLVKPGDGDNAVFIFRESPTDAYQYKVQAYKWLNRRLFTFNSRADDDRVSKALELSKRTLFELQYRGDREIPTAPGFCIDGGFFAGAPDFPHYERALLNFQFKSHPDVRMVIYTRTNADQVDEGLLARIEGKSKAIPAIFNKLAQQTATLRRGLHPVANMPAEENLLSLPSGETFSTHMFFWEASGKPRDLYAPSIVVEMQTGKPTLDGYSRPSLSDRQAIELFDAIVDSIRLRPTGRAM